MYNYYARSWIFFDTVIISADGHNTTKTFARADIYRDNSGGRVWEVVDISMGDSRTGIPNSDRTLLERIINSEETVIRFQGRDYIHDHTVTQSEKNGLREVLTAHDFLFGR